MSTHVEADLSHLNHDQRRSLERRVDFVDRFCAARGWDADRLTVPRAQAIHSASEFQALLRERFAP